MADRQQPELTLLGHLSARTGLGAASRNTLGLLDHLGFEFECADIETGVVGSRPEPIAIECRMLSGLEDASGRCLLMHANPNSLIEGVFMWDTTLRELSERMTLACVPFYELTTLPAHWQWFLGGLDFVLCPTDFVMGIVADALPAYPLGPRLIKFMQAVRAPENVPVQRDRWFGRRAETCVFLMSFDLLSDVARKNPWGTIEAFHRAFPDRSDVTLAIKVNQAGRSALPGESWTRLQSSAGADERLILLGESIGHADIWSLTASADAYVSLHRSEGLGLGMMEAMAVGCPVIATGWSGNMDFMDEANSIVIPYDLVPVQDASSAYASVADKGHWAEPRLSDAAQAMVQLAGDAGRRRRLGEAALASSLTRWDEYLRGDALRAVIARTHEVELRDAHRIERLDALNEDLSVYRRKTTLSLLGIKRQAVRGLRRLGLKEPQPEGEVRVGRLSLVTPRVQDRDTRCE